MHVVDVAAVLFSCPHRFWTLVSSFGFHPRAPRGRTERYVPEWMEGRSGAAVVVLATGIDPSPLFFYHPSSLAYCVIATSVSPFLPFTILILSHSLMHSQAHVYKYTTTYIQACVSGYTHIQINVDPFLSILFCRSLASTSLGSPICSFFGASSYFVYIIGSLIIIHT